MWMLYDPSLVPGITWPVKHKKMLLAKMRAYKALSQLMGKPQKKYLATNLQKFASISNQTTPILWSIAGGLESQKTSVLVKSNFVCTLPAASYSISIGNFTVNGQTMQKSLGFNYAGDILSYNVMANNDSENLAGKKQSFSSFFSKVFSYGPLKSTGSPIPMNAVQPFLWLSSFYNYGKILDFYGQPKGILKKRRFYRKHNNFQGKVK
uniref:Ribosomal protein S4 n=1 Tax=Ankistrodesmus falcatus TaxID=52960 RepID=A0A7L7K5R0_9CHLO|nr:ribosomal protein S4 [Ankistrodesmus falcatus]QMS48918.1 ribosomal protein S4 [Ankistrodesmus falcatus]